MNAIWTALAREAGLAAEHMAIGVTALGKANYAHHAYYGQAFFALTIGIERATKLAMVVDKALENAGTFPTTQEVRGHKHRLRELLALADQIAERRGLAARLPRSLIHDGIIEVLDDFASNVTRYYNLDLITGDPNAAHQDDPVKAWYEKVTVPVLQTHYAPKHRQRHERNASIIDQLYSGHSLVIFHAENGQALDNIYEASMQTAITEFAKPFTRMYVMQIIRFVGSVLSELGYDAQTKGLEVIPNLAEFFAIFMNKDEYFKGRKTWSIYRP